jgi:uncharacterized protein (TIGR03437 family)
MHTLLGTALTATAPPSTSVNPFQWTFIGPQPIGGGSNPAAGSVLTLAIDPHSNCTVYAGTYVGKLWKTTDCGQTWFPLSDSGPLVQIQSISLDPVVSNTLYILDAGVIYESSDGGATWTELSPVIADTTQGCSGDAFAIHPSISGTWLIAEYCTKSKTSSIYRSADGGTTWTQVLTMNGEITDLQFNAAYAGYAYACGFQTSGTGPESSGTVSFVISSDTGNTWTSAIGSGSTSPPSTLTGLFFVALAAAPSAPKSVYVRTESVSPTVTIPSLGGIPSLAITLFKTTDGGATWSNLNFPIDPQDPRTPSLLAVHPTNANLVFAGGLYLYRSMDGGSTWQRADSSSLGMGLHVDNHAMVFTPDASRAYESNDGGVWTSSQYLAPTIDWTNLNATFGTAEFYPGLSIDPTNPNRGFGGTQDNGTLMYTGTLGWMDAGVCGDGLATVINPIEPNVVYALCNTGIYRSTAGGLPGTWVEQRSLQSFAATSLVVDPANPATLYLGGTNLYQSLDNGNSFHQLGPTFFDTIVSIAIAPSDSNTVIVADASLHAWVTTNALSGTSSAWTQHPFSLKEDALLTDVLQIVIDPQDPAKVYASVGNSIDHTSYLLLSADQTVTWRAKNVQTAGSAGSISGGLFIDPDLPSTLYLLTDSSLFRSSDDGNSWSLVASGLPIVPVTSLTLHRASRTLRAGTAGRGAWDLAVPLTAPRLNSVSTGPFEGNSGFILTAVGANFDANSVVRLNGSPLPTTFVSNAQLTATIPAGSIQPSTVYFVAVYKPGSGGGLSDPQPISVGPTIFPNGVQNAASPVYNTRTGLSNDFSVTLSPGEFVSLYGARLATQPMSASSTPLPTTLAGAKVLVNDIPAPVSYASPSQINFVVPWEASGSQATITVQVAGSTSNSVNLPIATAPQIFTVNQQGFGQGRVLITGTSSLAVPVGAFPGSRPVKRGEYISIFATGLGPVQNQPVDGEPPSGNAVTTLTPLVSFGCLGTDGSVLQCGVPAQFSGLAPGFVGLYQVNVQVPDFAISGDAVPVNVFLGAISNFVTIAIE